MTWRKFLVLVNNLSPYGAVATSIRAMNDEKAKTGMDDEATANAFFSSMVAVGQQAGARA